MCYVNIMLSLKLSVIGFNLLIISHLTQSFVLLTANVEDVKKIARKFFSESVAQQIIDFITKASGNIDTPNVSEENEENASNVDNVSDNEIDQFHKAARQQQTSKRYDRFMMQTRRTTTTMTQKDPEEYVNPRSKENLRHKQNYQVRIPKGKQNELEQKVNQIRMADKPKIVSWQYMLQAKRPLRSKINSEPVREGQPKEEQRKEYKKAVEESQKEFQQVTQRPYLKKILRQPQQEPTEEPQQEPREEPQQEETEEAQHEAIEESQQEARQEAQQEARQEPQQEARQEAQQEARQEAQHEVRKEAQHEVRQEAQQEPKEEPQQQPKEKPQEQRQAFKRKKKLDKQKREKPTKSNKVVYYYDKNVEDKKKRLSYMKNEMQKYQQINLKPLEKLSAYKQNKTSIQEINKSKSFVAPIKPVNNRQKSKHAMQSPQENQIIKDPVIEIEKLFIQNGGVNEIQSGSTLGIEYDPLAYILNNQQLIPKAEKKVQKELGYRPRSMDQRFVLKSADGTIPNKTEPQTNETGHVIYRASEMTTEKERNEFDQYDFANRSPPASVLVATSGPLTLVKVTEAWWQKEMPNHGTTTTKKVETREADTKEDDAKNETDSKDTEDTD